jgi:hypothetical protein
MYESILEHRIKNAKTKEEKKELEEELEHYRRWSRMK